MDAHALQNSTPDQIYHDMHFKLQYVGWLLRNYDELEVE